MSEDYKKVVTFIITLIPFLFPQESFSVNLEQYIRKFYLSPDKTYQFTPVNRNKDLQIVTSHDLGEVKKSPGSLSYESLGFDDGLFVLEFYLEANRTLKPYSQFFNSKIQKKIYGVSNYLEKEKNLPKHLVKFEEYIQLKEGELIFYYMNFLDMHSKSFNLDKPKNIFNDKRKFLQSFVFINKGELYSPKHTISKEDPETGGYHRILWDVFDLNGRKLILIFNRIYENHVFEVYEVKANNLFEVLRFSFGGL